MRYVLMGQSGAIIVLIALLWWVYRQAGGLRADNALLFANVQQLTSANHNQMSTIARQDVSLKQWRTMADLKAAALLTAIAESTRYRLLAGQRAALLAAREIEDRGSKPCQDALALDLSLVCPSIAKSMVERAR
jgi:hypothetical protein